MPVILHKSIFILNPFLHCGNQQVEKIAADTFLLGERQQLIISRILRPVGKRNIRVEGSHAFPDFLQHRQEFCLDSAFRPDNLPAEALILIYYIIQCWRFLQDNGLCPFEPERHLVILMQFETLVMDGIRDKSLVVADNGKLLGLPDIERKSVRIEDIALQDSPPVGRKDIELPLSEINQLGLRPGLLPEYEVLESRYAILATHRDRLRSEFQRLDCGLVQDKVDHIVEVSRLQPVYCVIFLAYLHKGGIGRVESRGQKKMAHSIIHPDIPEGQPAYHHAQGIREFPAIVYYFFHLS